MSSGASSPTRPGRAAAGTGGSRCGRAVSPYLAARRPTGARADAGEAAADDDHVMPHASSGSRWRGPVSLSSSRLALVEHVEQDQRGHDGDHRDADRSARSLRVAPAPRRPRWSARRQQVRVLADAPARRPRRPTARDRERADAERGAAANRTWTASADNAEQDQRQPRAGDAVVHIRRFWSKREVTSDASPPATGPAPSARRRKYRSRTDRRRVRASTTRYTAETKAPRATTSTRRDRLRLSQLVTGSPAALPGGTRAPTGRRRRRRGRTGSARAERPNSRRRGAGRAARPAALRSAKSAPRSTMPSAARPSGMYSVVMIAANAGRERGPEHDEHEDQPDVVGLPHRPDRAVDQRARAGPASPPPGDEVPEAGAEVGAAEHAYIVAPTHSTDGDGVGGAHRGPTVGRGGPVRDLGVLLVRGAPAARHRAQGEHERRRRGPRRGRRRA